MNAEGVVTLSALGLIALGLLITLGVGLYVVNRHPANYDPARAARRYTLPAGVGVLLIIVGLFVFVGGLIALAIPN